MASKQSICILLISLAWLDTTLIDMKIERGYSALLANSEEFKDIYQK